MLDINRIRGDAKGVAQALAKRGAEVYFAELLEWDARRREIISRADALKGERNRESKRVPEMKRDGIDPAQAFEAMRAIGDEIARLDSELSGVDEKIRAFLLGLPNIPAEGVASGGKESNEVIGAYGELPGFGFAPKGHMELCADLKLIDYERGVKMGGSGFWLYTGMGARLEWALLNYFIETHMRDGYTFTLPPHILTYECGVTAGQFPKFEEDVFALREESFHFMLPTAETALINMYRGEILDEGELPKKLFAYTPCYRREAGAYRASERGMIRGHQFNKVEMFIYARPEDSGEALEELIRKARALVEGLGLHYRLVKLAAGDCSSSMATTYDIELWLPSMNEYKECSSVSNAMDYQARRGNIRFRRKGSRQTEYLHTLNGSGLATSRLIPAIVEQFQREDGSVAVPEPLRKYLGADSIK